MASFAHSQIPFSVKNSRLVQFSFRGEWFHRFVPMSATIFDLISLIQCDCRIERDLRLLHEDSVLVDSLQIEDILSNPIDLRVEEAGEWSSDRVNVDVQLAPQDKVTISCSPSATLGFIRSTVGLMFGVAFDRVELHLPDRELGLVQNELKQRVGECPGLQLLARSPQVSLNFGTPLSLGWLGQIFDLKSLVAQQLDLPLCHLKFVMNGVPLDDEMLLSELGLDTVKDLVVEWVHRPSCRVYLAIPDRVVVDVDSETTVGRLRELCQQIPERMLPSIDPQASVDSLECHPRRPLCFCETGQLKVVFNEVEFTTVARGGTEMMEITMAMAAQLGKGTFAVFCNDVEVSDFATVAELGYPTRLEIKRVVNPGYKFRFRQKIYRLFLVSHVATLSEARNALANILEVFPSLIAISPDGDLEMGIECSVTIPSGLCS
jgi:hypothetical protein